MKKWLVLLLCLTMAASFTACEKKKTEQGNGETTQVTEAQSETETEEEKVPRYLTQELTVLPDLDLTTDKVFCDLALEGDYIYYFYFRNTNLYFDPIAGETFLAGELPPSVREPEEASQTGESGETGTEEESEPMEEGSTEAKATETEAAETETTETETTEAEATETETTETEPAEVGEEEYIEYSNYLEYHILCYDFVNENQLYDRVLDNFYEDFNEYGADSMPDRLAVESDEILVFGEYLDELYVYDRDAEFKGRRDNNRTKELADTITNGKLQAEDVNSFGYLSFAGGTIGSASGNRIIYLPEYQDELFVQSERQEDELFFSRNGMTVLSGVSHYPTSWDGGAADYEESCGEYFIRDFSDSSTKAQIAITVRDLKDDLIKAHPEIGQGDDKIAVNYIYGILTGEDSLAVLKLDLFDYTLEHNYSVVCIWNYGLSEAVSPDDFHVTRLSYEAMEEENNALKTSIQESYGITVYNTPTEETWQTDYINVGGNIPVYWEYLILQDLKKTLAAFPEGMLAEIPGEMFDGLDIYLTVKTTSDNVGAYASNMDGRLYIVFPYKTYDESHIAHELMHTMEWRIWKFMGKQDQDFDMTWEKLNQKDFVYNYGEDTGDVDFDKYNLDFARYYGMTNRAEDLATVFELMFPLQGGDYSYSENEFLNRYKGSEVFKNKVDYLCECIRLAYPSCEKAEAGTFVWEWWMEKVQ